MDCLAGRLSASDGFPHEIGVFLGYPLADVKGFIENRGANYLCSGLWKVYCDEQEAQRTFQRYRKCTDIYEKLWLAGHSIGRLTVSA